LSTKSTKKLNVAHKEGVFWAGQGAGCQGGQCAVLRCPQSPQRSLALPTKRVFFGLAKALGVKVSSVLLNVVHKVNREV